jgi:hypothetical protein
LFSGAILVVRQLEILVSQLRKRLDPTAMEPINQLG